MDNCLTERAECSSCGEKFVENLGLDCWPDCLNKQLERKHRQVAEAMINYCLPKHRVRVIFPQGQKEGDWGWSNELKQAICIPWYTLRNKKEFFDTVSHEVGHISAFNKTFDLVSQNTIKRFEEIKEEGDEIQILDFYQQNQKLLDKYYKEYSVEAEESHWYDPWWLEYEKHFQNLLNSRYFLYAYEHMKVRAPTNWKKFVSPSWDPVKQEPKNPQLTNMEAKELF